MDICIKKVRSMIQDEDCVTLSKEILRYAEACIDLRYLCDKIRNQGNIERNNLWNELGKMKKSLPTKRFKIDPCMVE